MTYSHHPATGSSRRIARSSHPTKSANAAVVVVTFCLSIESEKQECHKRQENKNYIEAVFPSLSAIIGMVVVVSAAAATFASASITKPSARKGGVQFNSF